VWERRECGRLRDLLRKRGTAMEGDPAVEREILERFQDDCAVMILDSSGFTRLTQKRGIIHFLALVVAMHDQAKPILDAHHALCHWAEGDNLYAVFPTARLAVECSLAIQEAVTASNSTRPPAERLEVCIGVGAGRMLRIGDETVFGDPMNLASKLGEDIAGPGEVLVSKAARTEIGDQRSDLEFVLLHESVSGVDLEFFSVRRNA